MPDVPAPEFDPYYRWLGIAAEEQPPNIYRLLGLNLFESDPEVIALAADRQMKHVKSLASGQYVAHSQRLLNELSQARVELLNAERRTLYDAQLRAKLTAAHAPASAPPSAQQPPEPKSPLDITNETPSAIRTKYRRRRKHKANTPEMLFMAMLFSALVLGAILFYFYSVAPP